MQKNQFVLVGLAISSLTAITANAQFSEPFNTSGSLASSRTYNPPPVWAGFDYGTATASSTASATWSSQDAANNPSSGSAQLSWTWSEATDGDGSAAFTFDLLPSAQTFGSLSFDIMVDPSSTADAYGGYGYFQVVTRDDGYGFNDTGYAQELANPGYGSPASPGAGVWQHINIALTGADASVRAITLQDYDDAGRNINGPEIIYIDNIQLTPVPEPSTIALAGLGIAGLFCFRRSRKNN